MEVPITGRPIILAISTFVLATATFCSVSLWAFGEIQVQGYLHLAYIRKGVNFVLFSLLVYCAATLSGII